MNRRMVNQPRTGLFIILLAWILSILPNTSSATPIANLVMDARTGELLHTYNANTPLHPASLTKMMTLYIAFQAIERGEISVDDMVTISAAAAAEPPSKLGLRSGQKIRLRYLIRAAAIKSANDAATAIGVALEGSEAAFARRMNRMAQSMGMSRTTFRNAHGLTETGHMSTARDMAILGRHVIYDFPEYYNIFSRRSTNAGMSEVYNTNRRFLNAYRGSDGIKTGFTRAAGYNLVASAERGNIRIIAVVMGGTSVTARNRRAGELLDIGFAKAPKNTRIARPSQPAYSPGGSVHAASVPGGSGRTIRVNGLITSSHRPMIRPGTEKPELLLANVEVIEDVLIEAVSDTSSDASNVAQLVRSPKPQARPTDSKAPTTDAVEVAMAVAAATANSSITTPEVITRVSTSGGAHWGVNVGRYSSRYEAERVLVRIALNEMATLDGALRRVVQSPSGFDANFMGMSQETADLACRRLQARGMTCFMIGAKG